MKTRWNLTCLAGAIFSLMGLSESTWAQDSTFSNIVVPPALVPNGSIADDLPWRPAFADVLAAADLSGGSNLRFGVPAPEWSVSPRWATTPTDAQPGALSLATDSALYAAAPGAWNPPILPCACGCGIFEVGSSSMLPHGQGGMLWIEWDFQDQNQNWAGTSRAPAANNDDKDLRTSFFRLGLQYMINSSWGFQVELPFAARYFNHFDQASAAIVGTDWTALGDVRIRGLYTGFFEDFSLGVDFGVKLPTGDYTHDGADRDTEIGTGSTDILLGGYYRFSLTKDQNWKLFFQLEGDFPVLERDQYRPGLEIDASASLSFNGFTLGNVNIVPVGQVLIAGRMSDSGANSAQPVASGYMRFFLSPGIEVACHPFMLYFDVEFPVYQNMTGNQLVASRLYKVVLGFSF
jgi:hypothetical protein